MRVYSGLAWRPSAGSFISRGDVTSGSIHGGAAIVYVFLLFPPPSRAPSADLARELGVQAGEMDIDPGFFLPLPLLSVIEGTQCSRYRVRCILPVR